MITGDAFLRLRSEYRAVGSYQTIIDVACELEPAIHFTFIQVRRREPFKTAASTGSVKRHLDGPLEISIAALNDCRPCGARTCRRILLDK
jgi:hypothetical protein